MYSLQRYTGRSTKHTCPNCNRHGCFVYYVKEDGTALDPRVGRCDHQSSCGYHYKPRDFFTDHPGLEVPDDWKAPAPIVEKSFWTIDKSEVRRFRHDESTLLLYLMAVFNPDRVREVAAMYQLGAVATGATVFWQIDEKGRARTGKVMAYGSDGHRIKDPGYDRVNWMHSLLMRDGLLSKDFEITQCLFGAHLLTVYPDAPVVLVESEKTAVICAISDPTRVYVATGGKYGLTGDKMAALKGRRVTVIPDADAMDEWREKVADLQKFYDIKVGDPGYTEDDIINKRDIADLILK